MFRKYDNLIFEVSTPGRTAYQLPACDVEEQDLSSFIPADYLSDECPKLPEVNEVDIVRHYTIFPTKTTE